MEVTSFTTGGINLYTNPLIHSYANLALSEDGQVIRAVNIDSNPYGAKMKRPGYGTYVAGSAPNAGSATDLFSWRLNNGTQLYTYLNAGGTVYYSTQGTGAWTVCGNGTITAGSHVGYSVLNNTLVISQNGGTTRTSTTGTNFSDVSGAPNGGYLEQYQNKVYMAGTGQVISGCVTGDPTNWATTGTSDGTTITIPGQGIPNKLFKLADRLMIGMGPTSSLFRWDGYNLADLASNLGPSSPFSYGSIEDTGIWIHPLGIMTSAGEQPTLISNPIQRFFYNDIGSAIAGTSIGSAIATVHRYDYLAAVGSMTDDFTNETVNNAILKYNFQKNEFLNYSFNDFPTAMHSYKDATGSLQFIFGNNVGQCFTYGGTNTNDNGQPIESILELTFNFNVPHKQKDWKWIVLFFNPGCQAQIEFAASETFLKEDKNWTVIGDAREGRVFYPFPTNFRSSLLYVKIIESSRNSRFDYYGCAISADILELP